MCTPVSIGGGIASSEISNGEDDTFWSPSMTVTPHSPPFPATTHEQQSAPSTPNNNRSGTSPPEAAVEATPETTPVKVRLENTGVYVNIGGLRFDFRTGLTENIVEASTWGICCSSSSDCVR